VLWAVSCRPGALVPEALAPASPDSARVWAAGTDPRHVAAIRIHWRYEDRKVSGAGRLTAHVAPPDSVRLDYAASLGMAAGAGVVVGDSVLWADPARDVRSMVRGVPVFWATLGVVRPPGADARVSGGRLAGVPARWAWRFVTGGDTLTYLARAGARAGGLLALDVEWRRGGAVMARSHTEYDADGWPARARMEFPDAAARFEFTVVGIDTTAVLAPALWRARR